jgi:IS1 family transposase
VVIRAKKQKQCLPEDLKVGDCWIAISLADSSGLILAARVGKHTDELLEELIVSTEGKTDCKQWNSDDWGGYERVLPLEIEHYIGKDQTQRLERTNGIVRQQTGRWHRRQNKFGKVWEQTKVTVRLVVSYFNWIWQHSRYKTTAAQRAGLTDHRWSWQDILTFPTII